MYLQFPGDVAAVSDDGVDGDEEVVGNLLVRHSLHETDDDVFLAFGDGVFPFDALYHVREA